MNKKSASAVIDRLKLALKTKSDSELCRSIGIGRPTLGNWRQRDSVPYSLCVNLAESHNLSLDWVLAGNGDMLRIKPTEITQNEQQGATDEVGVVMPPKIYSITSQVQQMGTLETPRIYEAQSLSDRRLEKMADLLDGLSEAQQQEICLAIEEKKRLNQLELRLEELGKKTA